MEEDNYSKTSAYYKDNLKNYYKSINCRGKKINQYQYEEYDLDTKEYVFYNFILVEIREKVALNQADNFAKESNRKYSFRNIGGIRWNTV